MSMETAIASPWMDAASAAEYLCGMNREVLYRYCQRKKIQSRRVGNRYFFKQEWLDSFVLLNGERRAS
jgi:hypothetical protein